MPHIILLNGPPRSGKDTIAREIERIGEDEMRGVVHCLKFAQPLKVAAHAALNLMSDGGDAPLPADAFEDDKDRPLQAFFGLSPRQFYIQFSEVWMKPLFGHDIYGGLAARTVSRIDAIKTNRLCVFSDSGFASEARVLIEKFGPDRILLVRLHRPGTSFAGDSRSYLKIPELDHRTVDMDNVETGDPAAIARSLIRFSDWKP